MRHLMRVVIFGLFMAALASCSLPGMEEGTSLERRLIGRWREVGGQTTLEFFREGTLIVVDRSGATTNYFEVVDDKSIKVEPKYRTRQLKSDSRIWSVSVHGRELAVVEGKTRILFERQK